MRSPFLVRSIMHLARRASVVPLLALVACGGERGTAPELEAVRGAGAFTLRVTGVATRSVAGEARFQGDLPYSDIGTAFLLRDGTTRSTTRHSLYLHRWSDAPLAPGTYDIVMNDEAATRDDFIGGIGLDTGTATARACFAHEGTLVVTAASDQQVAGTIRFTAACLARDSQDLTPIVVEARFQARAGGFGPQP